jgi:heavy metal sensor kinase
VSAARRGLRALWLFLHTIRGRLTLWYVALLALILEAQRIGSAADLRGWPPSFGQALDYPPPGTVVVLYDRFGQRIVANEAGQSLGALLPVLAETAAQQQGLGTSTLRDGAHWRVLTVPVTAGGRLVGLLQVARAEQDVETALRQLVTLLALLVPATLMVASAGGLFLAARALNPIDQITRAADQIEAEDLSRRLEAPATPDEVGRLATTFNRMLDRLERSFRRQREFSADASHELRTPLAMLTSEADLALSRERPPAEYRQALASIRADAERMTQLVNELLLLSRAEAGQERLEREPLALGQLAADVVEAMQPLAETRGVRLAAGQLEPLQVDGDQGRLTQLLVNLVDNGLKYTPSGGQVTVSVGLEAGQALLRVADSGPGIAAEHLPHLFERFYRVDRARSRAAGGTGLGLAICRWIAEAHGGQIEVASQPGAGATFSVRLPCTAPDAARMRGA